MFYSEHVMLVIRLEQTGEFLAMLFVGCYSSLFCFVLFFVFV